jgi:dynein heavy chain
VDFELQLKRKNFSTPKNYLDFLNSYQKLLEKNRKLNTDMVVRYEVNISFNPKIFAII